MKKILVLFLTVCLLAAPAVFASAEDVTDLSGLNDEQLVALLAEVQTEIVARHIEKTASLPAGTCIGGRDVPAGPCVLAAAGTGDDDCWPYVIITEIMNDAREASRRYGSR